jgi:hypothetical protein
VNVSRFLLCTAGGIVLLAAGLLVPAHLRALDVGLVERAGRNDVGLLAQGQTMAGEMKLGTAALLAQAAQSENLPGWQKLALMVTNLAQQSPDAQNWGDDRRIEGIFGARATEAAPEPFTTFIVRSENRTKALTDLWVSPQPAVRELLKSRSLTRTELLPPSGSASGSAFDAAVATCGLLLDDRRISPALNDNLLSLTAQANSGHSSRALEEVLLDFLSLGERFNWDQLAAFTAQIPDVLTLHQLTEYARSAGPKLAVLFTAVTLSGNPAGVVSYLDHFNGRLEDLGASVRYGAAGVNELLRSGRRLYKPNLENRVVAFNPFGWFFFLAVNWCFQLPWLGFAIKWLCYLGCGFLLAAAAHFLMPTIPESERPLHVRGFPLVRQFLFALGFLLLVLLLSEPFLAQENQRENFSFRLRLPMVGGTVPAGTASVATNVMNPTILLTLLVFFVLQALIYVSCLVKLAEIRRQLISPRMKLRLLENEDHLFDAGLYLGFVGTIISLIIASMGLIHFSLMAAYSSTSFGIIFVVIFKIFHLRPARRKLLVEAELAEPVIVPIVQTP